MKIKDVLLTEGIDLSLSVATKDELFRKMSQTLKDHNRIGDVETFVEALHERDSQGPTGLGDGLAIPHGLNETVKEPTVLFCRLKSPVAYESLDDKDVDKVFMIAIPEGSGKEHLKLISELARKLVHKEFSKSLNSLRSVDEFLNLF